MHPLQENFGIPRWNYFDATTFKQKTSSRNVVKNITRILKYLTQQEVMIRFTITTIRLSLNNGCSLLCRYFGRISILFIADQSGHQSNNIENYFESIVLIGGWLFQKVQIWIPYLCTTHKPRNIEQLKFLTLIPQNTSVTCIGLSEK